MVTLSANWRDAAACQYVDAELFFPAKGGNVRPAKRICARCRVRAECLAWALATPERLDGIWGGMTARERSRLRPNHLQRAA